MEQSHQSYFNKRRTSASVLHHHGTGAKPTNLEVHDERRWSLIGLGGLAQSMDSSHRSEESRWAISPEETPLTQWLKSADTTPTHPIASTAWPYLQTPPADLPLMPLHSPPNTWNPRSDPFRTEDIDLPASPQTTLWAASTTTQSWHEDMVTDSLTQVEAVPKASVPTITPPTPLLIDEPAAKAAEVYTFPQPALPAINTLPLPPWKFQPGPAVPSPYAFMNFTQPFLFESPIPCQGSNPYQQVPQHMYNMNAQIPPFLMASYPMQQVAPQVMMISPSTVSYVMQPTNQGTYILVPVQTMPMPHQGFVPHLRPVEVPLRPAPRDVRPSAVEQVREQLLLAEVVKHIADSNRGGTCGFIHMQSCLREKSLDVVRSSPIRQLVASMGRGMPEFVHRAIYRVRHHTSRAHRVDGRARAAHLCGILNELRSR